MLQKPDIPDEHKPRRLEAKLHWWQRKHKETEASNQLLDNALKWKQEYDDESEEIRENHKNIGKGSRTHQNPLNEVIDRLDLYLKNRFGRLQSPGEVAAILKRDYWENIEVKSQIDPDGIIVEMEDENACIRWRHPDGKLGKPADWNGFRQRLARIRKAKS